MSIRDVQARSHVATAADVSAGVVVLQFDHIDALNALGVSVRAATGTFRAFGGTVSVNGKRVTVDSIDEPAVAATGVLTGTTIVADDTVTIGETTYTFVETLSDDPTVPYEVLLGENAGEAMDNLTAAINGDAGEGTLYSEGTEPHEDVTAEREGGTVEVTAKEAGTAGNSIATTASLDTGDFATATLEDGANYVAVSGAVESGDVVAVFAAHG